MKPYCKMFLTFIFHIKDETKTEQKDQTKN